MTNNEAIGILGLVVETAKGRCFVTDEAISDAYEMAINALTAQDLNKQVTGKLNFADDTISRQATLDWLKNEWNGMVTSLFDGIKALPSAQPERKKGKWEIYVISMLDGEWCRCSECGFEGAPYWDYCPNCGARMEGE